MSRNDDKKPVLTKRDGLYRAPWWDGVQFDAAGEPWPKGEPRRPRSLLTFREISHEAAEAEYAMVGWWDYEKERAMGPRKDVTRRQARNGRAEIAAWLEQHSDEVPTKTLEHALLWAKGHSYRQIALQRGVRRESVIESVRRLKKLIGEAQLAAGSTSPIDGGDE